MSGGKPGEPTGTEFSWQPLSLNLRRLQRFHRQVKLAVLDYAAVNSKAFVSKGCHLHDYITYYDVSVVQKVVGTEHTMQNEWIRLAELASLYSDNDWAWWITAYLASEALCCIMKFINRVHKIPRAKQPQGRSSVAEECKVGPLMITAGARRTCTPGPTQRCA